MKQSDRLSFAKLCRVCVDLRVVVKLSARIAQQATDVRKSVVVIKRERGNKRKFVLVKRSCPRGSAKETAYRSAVLEYSSESKEEEGETYPGNSDLSIRVSQLLSFLEQSLQQQERLV